LQDWTGCREARRATTWKPALTAFGVAFAGRIPNVIIDRLRSRQPERRQLIHDHDQQVAYVSVGAKAIHRRLR
jgi:hypothetical protein